MRKYSHVVAPNQCLHLRYRTEHVGADRSSGAVVFAVARGAREAVSSDYALGFSNQNRLRPSVRPGSRGAKSGSAM